MQTKYTRSDPASFAVVCYIKVLVKFNVPGLFLSSGKQGGGARSANAVKA